MRLSFIIPAHNEAALIASTLQTIHAAASTLNHPYEIILAADACTDDTIDIAAQHNVTIVQHDRRHIAATRNLGARSATGDILFFIDADTQVTREALTDALRAIESGAAGGGAPIHLDGPLPLYGRVMMSVLRALFRLTKFTGGAFLFATRKAFDAAGGWDETYFAAEELHLARRLKKQGPFIIIPTPILTSGRKLRTHTGREILALFLRGLFTPGMMKDRSKLPIFYGPRRADPH